MADQNDKTEIRWVAEELFQGKWIPTGIESAVSRSLFDKQLAEATENIPGLRVLRVVLVSERRQIIESPWCSLQGEFTTAPTTPSPSSSPPKAMFCPYCGAHKLATRKGVDRCLACRVVFFLSFGRYLRRPKSTPV
jgi:hypothetical protein